MDNKKEELIRYANDQLIGKGNLQIIETTFTDDYIAHAGGKVYSGHAFIKRFAKQLHRAIPNIRVVEIKIFNQGEDTTTWQRTVEGTHESAMQGIPPSGKKVKWLEMVFSRFENDLIAEDWVVSELLGELLLNKPRKEYTLFLA